MNSQRNQQVDLDDDYDYSNHDPTIKRRDFPSNFMFGVGTSAYQVEGAWNADGKGLNIWDCFTLRHPEKINDGLNGCVTTDSYHKIKEDVQLLKKMGVNYFRFSISWSRILPGGKVSMGKSLEGINHYNMLIDELKANDIEPFVTLFHWDLPNALEEEYMGFLSSKIVDDFVNYAEICYWEFGDRVKKWVTLNEPYRFTYSGYVEGSFPPGRGGKQQDGDPETEPYIVAYNLLNCHAAAYRKYQEDFKDVQKGEVGITLDTNFFKPYSTTANDVKAVEYAYDFMFGWFMEPLKSGNWPKNMKKFATTRSSHHPEGRILPVFSDCQKNKLIESYDFLGINYYTSNFAQLLYNASIVSTGFLTDCHYQANGQDIDKNYIGEPAFDGSWIYLCAKELVELLDHIKRTYKVENKPIIITENGAPDHKELKKTCQQDDIKTYEEDNKKTYEQVRDDAYRLKYIKWHLKAIKDARSKGIDVMGYFVWSFTDSFEWSSGYTLRFGMNYVDFKNNLQRYPKKSAIWFKNFLSKDKRGHHKRSLNDVEQDDEANATPNKAIEVVQKLKKTKA